MSIEKEITTGKRTTQIYRVASILRQMAEEGRDRPHDPKYRASRSRDHHLRLAVELEGVAGGLIEDKRELEKARRDST